MNALRDLIPGLAVIGIGLYTGVSTLRGNFSALSVVFDAFGIFFVGRGLYKLYSGRKGS